MLEFEDEKVPMKVDVIAPAGFVVIPVEQYNELLIAANAAPIKVRKSVWDGHDEIDAVVDSEWVRTVALNLMQQRYSEDELGQYDLVPHDDIYNPTITIAKSKPQAPVEPDPF